MTTRRLLGTGPAALVPADVPAPAPVRLLPVERADVDDDQEHDDSRTRATGPVPGRRRLGDRGQ